MTEELFDAADEDVDVEFKGCCFCSFAILLEADDSSDFSFVLLPSKFSTGIGSAGAAVADAFGVVWDSLSLLSFSTGSASAGGMDSSRASFSEDCSAALGCDREKRLKFHILGGCR